MAEYGGSGGKAAGAIARQALTACVDLGYLTPPGGQPQASAATATQLVPVEMLRDVAAR